MKDLIATKAPKLDFLAQTIFVDIRQKKPPTRSTAILSFEGFDLVTGSTRFKS